MSEDRNRLEKNPGDESDDVEAHRLEAQSDPESDDNDVEAHRLEKPGRLE